VVFGGFAAHELAVRIDDARPAVVVSASCGIEPTRIVDYKSGKALRHEDLGGRIDRGVRLQLALYAMAVARFFGADPARVSGAIKPLVVAGKQRFSFELAEKKAGLHATLELFASSIAAGLFPAFPDDKDIGSCKYCPVKHSCRTRHDAAERYAVAQSKEARTLLGSIGERR
jgi:hypothetical protein